MTTYVVSDTHRTATLSVGETLRKRSRYSEVTNFDAEVIGEEDVRGLDVSVDYVAGV